MRDYRSPGDQILNGIFIALWLLSRPFFWIYRFILAVAREAGNGIVKAAGGLIALVVVGYFIQLFLH